LSTRGKAAIVGAAESDLGAVGPGFTPLDLIGQATKGALADAGLDKGDVDGLFSASAYYSMAAVSAGEYLGIRPRYSDATNMGGSSFVSHLLHAAAAIDAGLCEVALVVYASTQRSGGGFRGVSDPPNPYETPYGPRYPVSMYALAASRHMHEYGTTREQLAEVAVAAREWAKLNPKAFMRGDLTVEDVLTSRMISSPLSLFDCTPRICARLPSTCSGPPRPTGTATSPRCRTSPSPPLRSQDRGPTRWRASDPRT
jgi:acetyl-CoA acetyltransferase